jgi:hypothetical protein
MAGERRISRRKLGGPVYNIFTNLQAETSKVSGVANQDAVGILGLSYAVHVDKEEAISGRDIEIYKQERNIAAD